MVITALNEQRQTFVIFVCAVVLAAAIASLLSTKQYEAVALIQLMPRAGKEVDVNQVVKTDDAGYLEGRDRARTQIQIILSRTVKEEVVRRYIALGNDDIEASASGYESLGRKMSASPREDTQLVEIAVMHPNPERASVLANLIADVYCDSNLDARTDAAREAQGWLSGQTTSSRAVLDELSKKVMDFKEANDLVDVDEKVDGITARMNALQAALGVAATQRVLLESTLDEHRYLLSRGQYDVLAGMFADPALETMAKEHATIVTEAAEVLSRYGVQHPEHQRAVAHIKRVEDLIAEEVKRNVDGERSEVETLRRQEAQITEALTLVKVELLDKQRLQAQYSSLKLEEDSARKLYGSLGERGAEVDLQARSRLNDVRVVDRALTPTRPAKPNIPLNMAMALALGVGGAFVLVLARLRFNDAILSTSDIDEYLQAPLLGVIPRLPENVSEAESALYSFDHPRSLPAEALRSIRAVLLTSPGRGNSRRLLVTSCLEGEGKTHAAIGIAVAFVQLGSRVLLIDADLRRPRLHNALGVAEGVGLVEALVDADEPERFVRRTRVPRLFLLARGGRVEFPNEFLAAPEVERVLVRLHQHYQVIILDTPPAAVVSDALALAKEADGVILIVRRGRATRSLVIKTLGQLHQVGARLLGVALNDVPIDKRSATYGSKYYDDTPRNDGTAVP